MASFGVIARRLSNFCTQKNINSFKETILKKGLPKSPPKRIPYFYRRYAGSYEGSGKTVGFVINKKNADVLCIEAIRTDGFVMANGDEVVGSIILFPHSVLSWHVLNANNVTEESLILFKILEPKLDILIFGYGAQQDCSPEVRKKFSQICKKLGIKYEMLPTEQACGIYNFLAAERRYTAGAFIPPTNIDPLRLSKPKPLLLDYDSDDEVKALEEPKKLIAPTKSDYEKSVK